MNISLSTMQGGTAFKKKIAAYLLASTALGLCFSVEAQAQDASANAIEEVVVTGSMITRNGYQAPTPLTVLSSEQLTSAATTNIADAVNRMPALAGSLTPASTTAGLSAGTAGLNNLNLRGLGANRTLTLIDGVRAVGSNDTAGGASVDVNIVPEGLIARVDIVTGGASAIYGSDAVAGVVNFVLDREFTGVKGEVGAGVSTYGDNTSYKTELTMGRPFFGGRAHVEIYGAISGNGEITGTSRPWTQNAYTTVLTPGYTATNGLPQYTTAYQVGASMTAPGGVITAGPSKGTAFGLNGTPFLLQGTVTGTQLIGGSYAFTRSDSRQDLAPKLSLANVFGRVGYELSDNTHAYVELQWASSRTYQFGGNPVTYAGNLSVPITNPFIPASIRAANATATSLTYGTSASELYAIHIDVLRGTTRGVAGLEGNFNAFGSNWKWSATAQHSHNHIRNGLPGDVNTVNLKQSFDAITDPSGAIVCRNPAGGCVPFNPFGVNVNSQAAKDYVTGTGYKLTKLDQDTGSLKLAGEPFSNWDGPVSIAAGLDWRKEAIRSTTSALDQAGVYNFGNYRPLNGHYSVVEGSLETVIPLATNTSWSELFDINAAGRAVSYSTSGLVYVWKVGATYQPIDDVKVRATRSRDIRAGNLAELFASNVFGVGTIKDDFNNNSSYTAPSATSGNINLNPETADTTAVGVVLTPTFLSNFQASVDYFNIKVNGAIATLTGQGTIDQCFLGNTSLCANIQRSGPVLAGSTLPNVTLVSLTPVNISSLTENGLDIDASYHFPVSALFAAADGDLAFHFLGTATFKLDTLQAGVLTQGAGTNQGGAASSPSFKYFFSTTYDLNALSTTVTMRGFSAGKYFNNYIQCTTGCPLSTTLNPTINNNSIPGWAEFDLGLDYKVLEDSTDLYLVVDNILNRDPPQIAGSLGGGYAIQQSNKMYDLVGRMFRAGVRFKL